MFNTFFSSSCNILSSLTSHHLCLHTPSLSLHISVFTPSLPSHHLCLHTNYLNIPFSLSIHLNTWPKPPQPQVPLSGTPPRPQVPLSGTPTCYPGPFPFHPPGQGWVYTVPTLDSVVIMLARTIMLVNISTGNRAPIVYKPDITTSLLSIFLISIFLK